MNQRSSWFSLPLLVLLVLLAPTARATTVIAPSFDRLVGTADYIVRAKVTSVTSDWRENPDKPGERYIGTLVALEVLDVIRGTPPSPLVLDLVGGKVGEQEFTIEGAPHFVVGQESILFVKGNGRHIIPLVGLMHGRYLVRRDKVRNRDEVMRNSGEALYSEQEVSLAEGQPSPIPGRDAKAQPLTPDEFATRIRRWVKPVAP